MGGFGFDMFDECASLELCSGLADETLFTAVESVELGSTLSPTAL